MSMSPLFASIIIGISNSLAIFEIFTKRYIPSGPHFSKKATWGFNEDISEEWTGLLNSWYKDNGEIIIENSLISSGIVHYRDESFMTKEIENVITNTFETNKLREETQT